jgi:hypothetical protein
MLPLAIIYLYHVIFLVIASLSFLIYSLDSKDHGEMFQTFHILFREGIKRMDQHSPNNSIGASADRPERRHILGRDFELIPIHIIKHIAATMSRGPLHLSVSSRHI